MTVLLLGWMRLFKAQPMGQSLNDCLQPHRGQKQRPELPKTDFRSVAAKVL